MIQIYDLLAVDPSDLAYAARLSCAHYPRALGGIAHFQKASQLRERPYAEQPADRWRISPRKEQTS